jgi:hypothetical protein
MLKEEIEAGKRLITVIFCIACVISLFINGLFETVASAATILFVFMVLPYLFVRLCGWGWNTDSNKTKQIFTPTDRRTDDMNHQKHLILQKHMQEVYPNSNLYLTPTQLDELIKIKQSTTNGLINKRVRAIILLDNNQPIDQVANSLRNKKQTVLNWLEMYKQGGVARLMQTKNKRNN